ncbi:MAG: ATP-dependent 6-phosphofructokinase [Deltaproteobacteria bacterium]|nr:ATP-dependent 6-phosphofructokinase [Deltaproteobacteria bacterium]
MPHDFHIPILGEAKLPSPLRTDNFVSDATKVLLRVKADDQMDELSRVGALESAGAREKIFFDPSTSKAAIVTCGGLCPGINGVIRAIVMGLYHRYGVKEIVGVRYGLQGFIPAYGHSLVTLSPEVVEDIHKYGGSVLSSSRGGQDIRFVVDALVDNGVNMLFCIGGDGTMKAAHSLYQEITRRNLLISVVGIPKTIDNDLQIIDKSFGFDTAIEKAAEIISCAHVEAKGAPMGIGLIKVMGRLSGHIAVGATLANADVNFTLIPELPFKLEGAGGLFSAIVERLQSRKHCVILVAEGAGQEILAAGKKEYDASGNVRLADVGIFLKNAIEEYFSQKKTEVNVKYFDPSYLIRSVPANTADSIYCGALGQYAVHAALSGKTGLLVGMVNSHFVHIPLSQASSGSRVDLHGDLWARVIETTGQPLVFG